MLSSRLEHAITLPLLDLVSTAEAISQNKDYALRATRHTDDELAALTDAFNTMLTEIEQRDRALLEANETLEARVARRTDELSVSNERMRKAKEGALHGGHRVA